MSVSMLLPESLCLISAGLLVTMIHRVREGQVLLYIGSKEIKVRRRAGYYFRVPGIMPCIKIELTRALPPGQFPDDESLARTLSELWRNDTTWKKRFSNEHSERKAVSLLAVLLLAIGVLGLIHGSIAMPCEGCAPPVFQGTEGIVVSIVLILLGFGGLHNASRRSGISRD